MDDPRKPPLGPDDATIVPEAASPFSASARDAAATLTPIPEGESNVPTSRPSDAATTRATSSQGYWSPGPALQPGNVLAGRYEILKVLGEGGMGAVYKAQDRELDRVVALKVIRPELAGNPAIIQRFKQELILARQVTHRNVIRIYDLGEAEGVKFITMEYVEGQDLHSLLLERQKCLPEEAADVMQQVCLALDCAHREGVIHRDLKPQNIMRDVSGRIVVMDFGLARSLEAGGMTQTGALIGTMEYMSPEQALGSDLDQRSDIFTVGLIFYELLSGKVPYKADSALASLLKRTQERAIPISEIDQSIPRGLSEIVSKCLERDLKLRYQTVEELMAGLNAWQGGTAAASIRLPAVRPWAQDLPWVWIAVTAVVLVLAVVGVVFRGQIFSTSAIKVDSMPVVTLAVVPFRNTSGDQRLDWLGSSIAEMLTTDVGQSAQLHVVSSDHMHQLLRDLRISPDTSLDDNTLRRLAQFSNADRLVWGQYTRFGDQIRIDATLHDLRQQRSIPLRAEARNENALLVTIDSFAQAIRGNLAVSASVVEELKLQSFKPSTKSLDALRAYDQGLELARDGKNLEAIKQFEASTAADPNFAMAYAKLGETHSRLGYGEKAEEFTRKAVDLSQQLPAQERYRILASQALVSNDNKKAIEYFENLAKVSPSDSGIQLALAQLYENIGSYDTARDYLLKLLAREPKHADALVALAQVEGERNNPQAAFDYVNRANVLAVQLDNDELRARVLYETGYIYRLLNKPDEALRNYQDSLAIRRRLGQKAGIAQALAEMAQVQDAQGKPDIAAASYKEAVQLQREIGDKTYLSTTLLNLGGLYFERGKYDEALSYLRESLQMKRELHNENHEAVCLNVIGSIYLAKGQFDDALTYYQQAVQLMEKLKIAPELPAALSNLGDASSRIGQYDQALADYLRALELARNAGDKYAAAIASYGMGTVFEYQGRYGAALNTRGDALKAFRELQDRSSWMADVLNGYGHTLTLLGRSQEAGKILDEELSLARETKNDTSIAQALNSQGERLFYAGDFRSAKPLFEQALKALRRSKDHEKMLLARVSLAALRVKEGRAREAIPELRRLAQEADTLGLKYFSVQCSVYMTEALLSTKDYDRARQEVDVARITSEKLGFKLLQAKSNYLLGEVLRITGKVAEAAPHYQQARRILQDMSKEAHADSFLNRSDLRPIVAAGAS